MGGYKPPEINRDFRYWISEHAVQRFRDRVDDDTKARTDRDLGLLLDERIHVAILAGKSTQVVDADAPAEDTRVVQIESRSGQNCFVVMRPHAVNGYPRTRTVGGPGCRAPLAITVLTSEMASRNYVVKQWKVANRPFAGKLDFVQPAPAPAPKHEEPVPKPKETAPAPASDLPKVSMVERIEWIKSILRERPNIKHSGPDGITALSSAKWGIEVSRQLVNECREVVIREINAGRTAALGHPLPSPPPPYKRPGTPPSVPELLAAAMQREANAKEALQLFDDRQAEMRAKLVGDRDQASIEVEGLMKQMMEMRK